MSNANSNEQSETNGQPNINQSIRITRSSAASNNLSFSISSASSSSKSLTSSTSYSTHKLSFTNLTPSSPAASTPASIVDPNDEIWLEFLSSLQEPIPSQQAKVSESLQSSNNLNNYDIDSFSNNQIHSSSNNHQITNASNNNSNQYLNTNFTTTNINPNQCSNILIDNDDVNEDPDFTVCLDNYDLDDPDYMDDWFLVPKKEAVELVKDAIEFCDTVPIVCEIEQRSLKTKLTRKITNDLNLFEKNNNSSCGEESSCSTSRRLVGRNHSQAAANLTQQSANKSLITNTNINKSTNEFTSNALNLTQNSANTHEKCNGNQNESGNNHIQSIENQQSIESTLRTNSNHQASSSSNSEYIPQFDDLQRRQLDEQLRNHVQLLTQTCLISSCSNEYKNIFDEAFGLLKVLDGLNKPAQQESISDENSMNGILSPSFQIINLNDAIELVNDFRGKSLDEQQNKATNNNFLMNKQLETILTSPVFYNINLIPSSKFIYQSHFKRSMLTDSEKILLIMGYNKFKHLSKDECSQCIREHLLPQRSCCEIKKHLSTISNPDQRQLKLKELLRRQKLNSKPSYLKNFEFIKEIHYKSPLDQSNINQLPSMYTIVIERLRMANVIKETKQLKQIEEAKKAKTNAENKKESENIKVNSKKQSQPKQTKKKRQRKDSSSPPSPSVSFVSLSSKSSSSSSSDSDDQSFADDTIISDSNENDSTIASIQTTDLMSKKKSNKTVDLQSTPVQSKQLNTATQNFDCSFSNNISQIYERQTISNRLQIGSQEENSKKKTKINENDNKNPNRTAKIIPQITRVQKQQQRVPQQPLFTAMPSVVIPANNANNFFPLISLNNASNYLNNRVLFQPNVQQIYQPQPQQQQQPFILPTNFKGTILYQPTIHIHANTSQNCEKKPEAKKYRQIVPKTTPNSTITSAKKAAAPHVNTSISSNTSINSSNANT